MSFDFGQNTKNGMPMNPLRTIGSITAYITSLESGTGIGQNRGAKHNSSDGIPPRNIKSIGLFNIGTSDIYNIRLAWHGALKGESEKPLRQYYFRKLLARE